MRAIFGVAAPSARGPMSGACTLRFRSEAKTVPLEGDDLARDVHVILGVPIDVVDMPEIVARIDAAAADEKPFLVSTVNVNFLVASQFNATFKESLYRSDLCTVDGMPVLWVMKLLGVPVKERTAGTDLLEALKLARGPARPLKVFVFGGTNEAANTACATLNAEHQGLECIGWHNPGFGSVAEMSSDGIIKTINASGADFLVAALGAAKGQTWLLENHDRLRVPVRAHLGAALNIQAGTVKRAPRWMRKAGLEWVWRIKEEPYLWRRYASDGLGLFKLLLTRIGPLVALDSWYQFHVAPRVKISVERSEDQKAVTLKINGAATAQNIGVPLLHFQYAAASGKDVIINFSDTRHIDTRFLGLLLMLDRKLNRQKQRLIFKDIPAQIGRLFRLNGFGHLQHC